MSELKTLYDSMIESMGVKDLQIPGIAVKFFRKNDEIPENVKKYITDDVSLTSCQAERQAALGDPVCITMKNIGCIAAAISFGLVDPLQDTPLEGSRVYTDIMKDQLPEKMKFTPPSPKELQKE